MTLRRERGFAAVDCSGAKIERLWREQGRLYDAFNLEGRVAREDLDEVYRLWDRADELTEQALQAPVSTTREALAMLRLIQHQAFERDIDKWEELYPAAMDRVLAALDGDHGSAKPGSQYWRF